MNRTAVVMLASGRSRRFGWRDKLLQAVGGKMLMDHAAGVVSSLDALVRIAVCPADHPRIAELLQDRFVIALNKQPGRGMGHSIAIGVEVAMQFKPEAIAICMADMPFIEPEMIRNVVAELGREGANVVHSGGGDGSRPPTAFDASCFGVLRQLDGDDGARGVMRHSRFKVVGVGAPALLLTDVDTKEDLEHARELMAVRDRHLEAS
jgi:molybdenum cofactor cytidylyltransferase